MADNKKSFVLYSDLETQINLLTDDEAGRLFRHILAYVNDRKPEFGKEDRLLAVSFEPIKQQLKRDLKKYESIKTKRAEAGRKGGMSTQNKGEQMPSSDKQKEANQANASIAKQAEANQADNVNDTVNVNDNVNDTVIKEEEKEKITSSSPASPLKFPSMNDVLESIIDDKGGLNEIGAIIKIVDKSKIPDLLYEFYRFQTSVEKVNHLTKGDFKSHFYTWYGKRYPNNGSGYKNSPNNSQPEKFILGAKPKGAVYHD